MSERSPVTALRVANEAFLVSSMIERCPKTMMLRELVVNAIEAAMRGEGERLVEITARIIDGTPKLCIRNTGPGLSAMELHRICDLASSLHKENSLDGNFGMGAKVASLPSNRHMLRYRSCKAGRVSEVVLCERSGVYGRLCLGTDAAGNPLEVLNVTDICQAEGDYDLSRDWTEVVLGGNHARQNTVVDPYDGSPRYEAGWLAETLALRFFRLPAGLTLHLRPEVAGGSTPRRFETFFAHWEQFKQTESVRTASGITIHYCYDPTAGEAHPGQGDVSATTEGLGCIVYKGEIYDVRARERWVLEGPSFGFSFGAKHCKVFVELPDDYVVRPEAYRQFLRFRGGDQQQVFLAHFSALVRTHLPEWLLCIIRSYGPDQAKFANEVQDELRDLLAELGVEASFIPRPSTAPGRSVEGSGKATTTEPKTAESQRPERPPSPPRRIYERPPEIIGLDQDEMIAERGLTGRVAQYFPQSHQIFINFQYSAVLALAEQLEAEFGPQAEAEEVRASATEAARWAVTRRIARALVYSFAKKAAGWKAEDVQRSQSPESLCLIVDDWSAFLPAARIRLEEMLPVRAGTEDGAPGALAA
ncbi:ATP-binding protein [Rhodovastum atsumiense]|uniref:ATP-binding protein n=1 Tax=Rhodovastum atsumiense TaxID=504468 RepID=A0A5M6IKS7_9PROT|nr:ATP-binding protein [Rhodovastum atsumiense]KAA5608255.1 ATP-binding protein [Rhodovastum atsumiense]CAH2603432.1 ATP-binding protein [Rhodovastum atsumiense]